MIALPNIQHPIRHIGGTRFDFSRRVAVMAIVNRTPDSFYDQGATFALDKATEAALEAIALGAHWIDIGGVKFAPGPPVPVEEEIERVIPVITNLKASGAVISVDTFHAAVARAAIDAGASVINDTTGLSDPAMAQVVAETGATAVITHSLAKPRQPHPAPTYRDVVQEVVSFLTARVDRAINAGVHPSRIVIDPGHDLNKNTTHSLELTRRLHEITGLGYPTLVAISNKDFIGESIDRVKAERIDGSIAAMTACILQGARIVRMHNVRQTVDAAHMAEAILGLREPANPVHNMPRLRSETP